MSDFGALAAADRSPGSEHRHADAAADYREQDDRLPQAEADGDPCRILVVRPRKQDCPDETLRDERAYRGVDQGGTSCHESFLPSLTNVRYRAAPPLKRMAGTGATAVFTASSVLQPLGRKGGYRPTWFRLNLFYRFFEPRLVETANKYLNYIFYFSKAFNLQHPVETNINFLHHLPGLHHCPSTRDAGAPWEDPLFSQRHRVCSAHRSKSRS